MRFFVAAIGIVIVGLSAALFSPAAALACSPKEYPENEHCYGIAQWAVASGEGFKGLEAELGINSEALYAWEQEGEYNHITDEEWLEFDEGEYWNESGELLGCATLLACTPEHEDRFFWFANTEKDGEVAGESSEGNKGPEEWEVVDEYDPSSSWFVKSKNWSADVHGQPSYAASITAGVETTTSDALDSAGASGLNWEGLKGVWHTGDWSDGNSHAGLTCDSPAKVAWITKYDTFGYGVNIEFPCDNEGELAALAPLATEEPERRTHIPPTLRSLPASSTGAAAMPNTSSTSPMSMPELKTHVTALAANLGEPDPSSIEVATASRGQAMAAVTPGLSFSETGEQKDWLSESTYAVVLHGNFESAATPSSARSESRSQPKPYTTLSLVLDAKTGAVTAFELTKPSQQQPAISSLPGNGEL